MSFVGHIERFLCITDRKIEILGIEVKIGEIGQLNRLAIGVLPFLGDIKSLANALLSFFGRSSIVVDQSGISECLGENPILCIRGLASEIERTMRTFKRFSSISNPKVT